MKRRLDQRAAYLGVCAHGPPAFNGWDRLYEQDEQTRIKVIRYHAFDILGTQEGLADQIADLAYLEEFDHEGEVARRNSADLMLRKIAEIICGEPVICEGDLSLTQTRKYAELTDSVEGRYSSDHDSVVARVVVNEWIERCLSRGSARPEAFE
ncbi:MAG: hypothetical protein ABWY02_05760 [Telluria sp.]